VAQDVRALAPPATGDAGLPEEPAEVLADVHERQRPTVLPGKNQSRLSCVADLEDPGSGVDAGVITGEVGATCAFPQPVDLAADVGPGIEPRP
jgi:hypothetical protein